MPTPTIGYQQQFPMLASGLTNTMPSQGSSEQQQQQMMALFQMLQSQIQGQPVPQMEQAPQQASPAIAFLSQLLGNVGSAISQNPQYSSQVYNTLSGQREQASEVGQRNLQRSNMFDLQRQSAMMDLAMKRLDIGIGQAKQAQDAQTEKELLQMKADLQAKQQQIDFEHDLAKINEAQKAQTEREAMKQQQLNDRAAKHEAGLQQRVAARASQASAKTAAKGTVKAGSTKTPQSNWPSQYMKSYSTDLADAAKAVKEKLSSDEVKRHIGPMAIGGPDAKKVKAVRDQYEKYKKDLFEYYQNEVDKFMKEKGGTPAK